MKQITILSFISLLCSSVAFSQWECRSKLGAHLKPVGESNVMWASEISASGGYLSNSSIANVMGLVGLDYTTNKHSFYLEGGYKYWNRYDLDSKYQFTNFHPGMREAFYKFKGTNNKLSLGLQSAGLKDYYLMNERMAGLSYEYNKGRWGLQIVGGSVSTDFSRNGIFCNTCYLYDIIPNRSLPDIGSQLGQTNVAALTLSFLPQAEKSKKKGATSASDDEFESFSDEFATVEEASKSFAQVMELGLVAYTEFGSQIDNQFYTGGLYLKLELLGGINIKPEVLLQTDSIGLGVVSIVSVEKNFFMNNGHKSSLLLSYVGFTELDEGTMALNRYSNILAGEVLRLDAPELPVYLCAYKHQIPKTKAHFKIQYAQSMYTETMQELDLQVGKTFFKHLLVNAIGGYIKSDLIPNYPETYLGRIEMRFSF